MQEGQAQETCTPQGVGQARCAGATCPHLQVLSPATCNCSQEFRRSLEAHEGRGGIWGARGLALAGEAQVVLAGSLGSSDLGPSLSDNGIQLESAL